jgi:UDP-N-acetylmuramoyl-tripeptide--D-alanyl-D-alanine ligase
MRFDEHFLKAVLSESEVINHLFPKDASFSIDTRTLQEGDIFVALPGHHCDGHEFIKEALEKGASGIIIEKNKKKLLDAIKHDLSKKLVIAVSDTLHALIRLATAWRSQFTYPVVAITGSLGKTSTKEIVANILTTNNSNFLVSRGNQNTMIGVALNMLRMRQYHEVAVFEVGVSRRGEMAQLAQMLRPQTALITNICHSHMEGLGSLADIAMEKKDIFKFFNENSIGIINGDQPIIAQVGYLHPVVRFGAKTINQIQARKVNISSDHISFILKVYREKYKVILQQVHEGAVFNTIAAVAVTQLLGIPVEIIVKGIQLPLLVKSRFEQRFIKDNNGGIIIDDCYNANPESMKAALLALQKVVSKGEKIAVLGDMLELGVNSPFWHRQLGRFLRKVSSLNHVILVGTFVQWTYKTVPVGIKVDIVPTWQDAVSKLKQCLVPESTVLVKGSQGMQLNKLVSEFTQ